MLFVAHEVSMSNEDLNCQARQSLLRVRLFTREGGGEGAPIIAVLRVMNHEADTIYPIGMGRLTP